MGEILRARLGEVRLESVLQLAEGEMFTGQVLVGDDAVVRLREGRLVGAEAAGRVGARALLGLFFRRDGDVCMHRAEVPDGAGIGSMMELIMEGLRLLDEWERIAPMILRVEQRPLRAPLDALESLFDGEHTVAEVVLFGGQRPEEVVDPLLAALGARSLRAAAPPDVERARGAAAPPAPEAYYELFDLGRNLMKQGRLAEAEVALRKALMARPGDRVVAQNLRRVSQLRLAGGA